MNLPAGDVYTPTKNCMKTSALSEVLAELVRHELSTATFSSKRERVRVGVCTFPAGRLYFYASLI